MTRQEQDPNEPKKKEFSGMKDIAGIDVKEALKTQRITRCMFNTLITFAFYASIFLSESGREALRDPIKRRFLFRREYRIGLLEEAILNNEIYHPNKEATSLELRSALAGRWVSFDFRRPQEFNLGDAKHERQKGEGRLSIFSLDEIENNDPDQYTPTLLFDLFNAEHMLSWELPSLEDAISRGYLRETTYIEAYRKVGIYERYRTSLILSGIAESPIYTVTPKGNGVVFLIKDGGRKSEKPKAVPEFKPALQT